jgi:prophage antirepressor-like protein|nr:MAG TPA: BRO family protein [Caudoviricetes sp.]
MPQNIKIVGTIVFGGQILNVYGDLDDPLFRANDIGKLLKYSSGNDWKLLEMCEEDEKLKLPLVVAGQRRSVNFVTEHGLYNILSQSRMKLARAWRRIVHDELINLRKNKGLNISEQFEEWDQALDNIYFDEETGMLMQSVTVQGGDVIQIPYED